MYLSSNVHSKFYATRQDILNRAVDFIERILECPDHEQMESTTRGREGSRYDQLIIVAHSLGSVIAFDALNRILNRSAILEGKAACSPEQLQKIRLFVTMGSPLDKVDYFFRLRIPEREAMRRHIVEELYPLKRGPTTVIDSRGTAYAFSSLEWWNIWSPMDILSGSLDAYGDVNNCCSLKHNVLPLLAHNQYWSDPKLYTLLLDRLANQP